MVNQAAADALGRAPAEILGKTDADRFPALEAARRRKDDQETLSGGVAVELPEQWLTAASGELRVMATTKTPVFDSRGRQTHVVGASHDITRLKALEASLKRSKKDFVAKAERRVAVLQQAQRGLLQEERSAVLGQLAAGLAHQLLNSFGAILNASSVMARKGKPEREFGKALQALRREVQVSSATIQDLLSHTQVRPPKLRPASVATSSLTR